MKHQLTKAEPAFKSRSSETGSEYTIYIDAPPSETSSPVVFLMDGDVFFDAGVRACRALSAAGTIPPTLVAGVGYGVGLGKQGNHRARDYTPTAWADEPSSGGADPFLAYLSNGLWPEVARRYSVRESGRTIAGHSLGSLVVLHALFQERPFFDLALASAPSIWWDNRSLLGLVAKLRDRQPSLAGKLYLGVGADDTPSMLGDLALLEEQLARRPFDGLRVESERFPGHDHYDVLPFTLKSGLAALLSQGCA